MRQLTAVFDLDGTLVDSANDLIRATNHTLQVAGLSAVPGETLRTTVSHGARAMLEQALRLLGKDMPKGDVDRLQATFLAYYADNIAIDTRPFPGAIATLGRMRTAGARLAVCTNKTEQLARRLLRAVEMDGLFHAITGRDTLPVCKPDPGHLIGTVILADGDLSSVVMVGDSEIDIKTARAAGIPSIGVTFGYSPEPIDTFQPGATIAHFDELEPSIRRLMPNLA